MKDNETYDLVATLDAYEVEELDAHDLAQFLAPIAPERPSQQEQRLRSALHKFPVAA